MPEHTLDDLLVRARRMRRKGDVRKMLVALRDACARFEGCAWLWALYGGRLAEHGKKDEAKKALQHAVWLRRTEGDTRRMTTTQALLDRCAA